MNILLVMLLVTFISVNIVFFACCFVEGMMGEREIINIANSWYGMPFCVGTLLGIGLSYTIKTLGVISKVLPKNGSLHSFLKTSPLDLFKFRIKIERSK